MAVKNQILFSLIIQIIFRVFWFGVGMGIVKLRLKSEKYLFYFYQDFSRKPPLLSESGGSSIKNKVQLTTLQMLE